MIPGGGGEIRTHERLSPLTVFKTVAFNRSATPPGLSYKGLPFLMSWLLGSEVT